MPYVRGKHSHDDNNPKTLLVTGSARKRKPRSKRARRRIRIAVTLATLLALGGIWFRFSDAIMKRVYPKENMVMVNGAAPPPARTDLPAFKDSLPFGAPKLKVKPKHKKGEPNLVNASP